ncbi:MAG: hypothetical protein ACMXYA_02615 [Candidatus Woesearchaeota archaeon]
MRYKSALLGSVLGISHMLMTPNSDIFNAQIFNFENMDVYEVKKVQPDALDIDFYEKYNLERLINRSPRLIDKVSKDEFSGIINSLVPFIEERAMLKNDEIVVPLKQRTIVVDGFEYDIGGGFYRVEDLFSDLVHTLSERRLYSRNFHNSPTIEKHANQIREIYQIPDSVDTIEDLVRVVTGVNTFVNTMIDFRHDYPRSHHRQPPKFFTTHISRGRGGLSFNCSYDFLMTEGNPGGDCTDFSHVTYALLKELGIPSMLVMGKNSRGILHMMVGVGVERDFDILKLFHHVNSSSNYRFSQSSNIYVQYFNTRRNTFLVIEPQRDPREFFPLKN